MVTISPWGMITDSVSLPPSFEASSTFFGKEGPPFGSVSPARRYLCAFVGACGTGEPGWRLFGYGWHADSEAAMKTVLLGLTGLVFCGVLIGVVDPVIGAEKLRLDLNPATGASLPEHEGIHAARVDMASVIDMSHASPDTWGTLPPPVDLFERLRAPAPPLDEYDIPDSMFGTISLAAN
jgi:hypothetical protein